MFIRCNSEYAIMAASRCGHTNMYHYHGLEVYSTVGTNTMQEWKEHHNPIVVLRNPLDRVMSAMLHTVANHEGKQFNSVDHQEFFYQHCYPYLHELVGINFRIIDFYDLDKYIPRSDDLEQSYRTDSHVGDATVEDVHVMNEFYTLQDLEREIEIYQDYMVTKERVSVEEWKELTH